MKNRSWLILLSVAVLCCFAFVESKTSNDFEIFLQAAHDLFQGKNIYLVRYKEWYHYYYSVDFAIVLYPLTLIPIYLAKIIWYLLNAYLFYRLLILLIKYLPFQNLSKKAQIIIIAVSIMFVFNFVNKNLHLGQVTIFLLWSIFEGLNLIKSRSKLVGSALIAFVINLKLLPLVLIPYFIVRRKWIEVLYIIIVMIGLNILPSIVIGFNYNTFLLKQRLTLLNPMNKNHILDVDERSFHSITTLLSTLLVKDTKDNFTLDNKRNIADISLANLNFVIQFIRLFFILLTFFYLRKPLFQKARSELIELYELSYILLLAPLLFPHQQQYQFLFTLPSVLYLIFFCVNAFGSQKNEFRFSMRYIRTIFVLTVLVFFSFNGSFLFGFWREYFDHFKILTYGVLLIPFILAICPPEKLLGLPDFNLK